MSACGQESATAGGCGGLCGNQALPYSLTVPASGTEASGVLGILTAAVQSPLHAVLATWQRAIAVNGFAAEVTAATCMHAQTCQRKAGPEAPAGQLGILHALLAPDSMSMHATRSKSRCRMQPGLCQGPAKAL